MERSRNFMGRKFTHNAQRLLALMLVFLMAFGQMDIVIASGIADQLSEQQSVSEPVTTQVPIPSGKQAEEGVQNTAPPTQPPEGTKPPEKTEKEAVAEPTAAVTVPPAVEPTAAPTVEPTVEPTVAPTVEPTAIATAEPTVEPTKAPTVEPTVEPTKAPTVEPTVEPTKAPAVEPTAEPTVEPTVAPTVEPMAIATAKPAVEPTVELTAEPTQAPAADPTQQPTSEPTVEPTVEATTEPTAEPTPVATAEPTPAPMRMTAQMRIMAADGVDMTDAAAVVEKAIADNISLEVPYVSISATALSDKVLTGEAFTYSLYIYLRSAPQYNNIEDNNVIDTYKKYDKVTVTITAPENIDLYNADGSLFARAGETKEIVYENVAMGTSRRFELKGQMTNNGEAEDGTKYAALGITMSADVTVTNVNTGKTTKHSFQTDNVPVTNNTQVSNQASNEWTVEKEAETYDATNKLPEKKTVDGVECYVFEYTIKAGKAKDGKVLANDNDYNAYGTLDFSSFTLTDTMPVIAKTATGKENAKPVWASIELNGKTVAEQTDVQNGVTQLTTNEYTRKDYSQLTGSKVPGEIPYYSEYTVKVAYPVEYFFLPYGEYNADTQPFKMENKAEIRYTPLDETEDKAEDKAELTYIEKGEPAQLTGYKNLIINKAEVAYEGDWKGYFPGGAEFSVYAADNWKDDKPIDADATVGVLVVGGTTETTNQSQILDLPEGTYYVMETKAPDKTKVTGEPQKVELVAGQLTKVTFVNEVDGMGLLELKKVDDQGKPMAVTFELWPVGQVGNGEPAASGTTSSTDGVLHMLVPVGTYTLHEVAPTGYIPAADQEVTIKNLSTDGRTTLSGGNIVNERDSATLTIMKYAQGSGNKVAFTQTNTGYDPTQIKFKLSWTENGEAKEEEIPLQANGQAVKSQLKRKNNDGTYIQYTLTEISAPNGVVMDASSISWQFDETDGKYNYTAEFTNRIQSQLKIKKQQQDLGDDGKVASSYPKDVSFTVYAKEGDSFKEVGTWKTGEDGVATTDSLYIADEKGAAIEYYVVETVPSGYQVTYPAATTIQVGGQDVQAWGPITLNNNPETDKTSSLVLNKETKGRIEVTKVDAANTSKKLSGAEFTLTGPNGFSQTVTTDATGMAVFNNLELGVAYTLTETKAPDGYVATYQGEKITLDTPLKVFTVTVENTAKPFLKVKKTAKDVTTGTPSTLSGVVFEVYQKQTDGSFTRVGTLSLTTGANN